MAQTNFACPKCNDHTTIAHTHYGHENFEPLGKRARRCQGCGYAFQTDERCSDKKTHIKSEFYARNLDRRRKEKGMSRKEMAVHMGITFSRLSSWMEKPKSERFRPMPSKFFEWTENFCLSSEEFSLPRGGYWKKS